ncbi:MAG: hypothetical protein ACRYF0_17510 [Janthinobacterium lividum]
MSKKLHVNCFLVFDKDADAFRRLVDEHNNPASYEEHQAEGYEHREPVVEILYEESSKGRTGFDLWFMTPAIAFYFGGAWARRLAELAQLPAAQQPARAGGQVETLIRPEELAQYKSAIHSEQVVLGQQALTLVSAEVIHEGQNVRLTLAYEEPRALLMLGELVGRWAERATWTAALGRQQEGGPANV